MFFQVLIYSDTSRWGAALSPYSPIFPVLLQSWLRMNYLNLPPHIDHPSCAIRTKESWEHEMGMTLDNDWWDCALNTIHKTSISARLTLVQFKVIFRYHYSKTKLSKIFLGLTNNWDRFNGSPCHLTHTVCYSPFHLFRMFGKPTWRQCLEYSEKLLISPHM